MRGPLSEPKANTQRPSTSRTDVMRDQMACSTRCTNRLPKAAHCIETAEAGSKTTCCAGPPFRVCPVPKTASRPRSAGSQCNARLAHAGRFTDRQIVAAARKMHCSEVHGSGSRTTYSKMGLHSVPCPAKTATQRPFGVSKGDQKSSSTNGREKDGFRIVQLSETLAVETSDASRLRHRGDPHQANAKRNPRNMTRQSQSGSLPTIFRVCADLADPSEAKADDDVGVWSVLADPSEAKADNDVGVGIDNLTLTPKLGSRLLEEILEELLTNNSSKKEAAATKVHERWGFPSYVAMLNCLESLSKASTRWRTSEWTRWKYEVRDHHERRKDGRGG